jgi:hypothetical protein
MSHYHGTIAHASPWLTIALATHHHGSSNLKFVTPITFKRVGIFFQTLTTVVNAGYNRGLSSGLVSEGSECQFCDP